MWGWVSRKMWREGATENESVGDGEHFGIYKMLT